MTYEQLSQKYPMDRWMSRLQRSFLPLDTLQEVEREAAKTVRIRADREIVLDKLRRFAKLTEERIREEKGGGQSGISGQN